MSIYDNKTSNFYPDLNSIGLSQQEVNSQNYRLAKISETGAKFLEEIAKRDIS